MLRISSLSGSTGLGYCGNEPELACWVSSMLPASVCSKASAPGMLFFWQRQFEALGHTVRIIAPQYVKPFVKHQKSDRNDVEAICTAMRQPNMKFVPTKNEVQQDIQARHRARSRLVNRRTALVSQMRGLLLDLGVHHRRFNHPGPACHPEDYCRPR